MMSIFLGGLSVHLSGAILSHLLGIDKQWEATAKEWDPNSSARTELPKILRRFWGTLAMCAAALALMLCGAFVFPEGWRITHVASIFPLANMAACHFLLPIALSPALMSFRW